MSHLRLATRGSALALAQTEIAAAALKQNLADLTCETVVVRTAGDVEKQTPIEQMPGQGWFTAELERVLLEDRAEVAVHSAKDLPTQIDASLEIAALLSRADPADALITRDGSTLDELPAGAKIGTSSVRRVELLRALRPDVVAIPMRGNVDTRLRKLDEGEVDALLLAAAGLDRLGLGTRISQRLEPTQFVPAPAQGIIALQCRRDSAAAQLCRRADDAAARSAFIAERALLSALGGSCLLPLGAWARLEDGALVMDAAWAGDDGQVRRAHASGSADDPEELARVLAAQLQ